MLILSAGLAYGKIPSGPQKVDHSSFSGWLMLFTQNEIVLSQRKFAFVFLFFSLFTPEETSLGAFSPWLANKDQEDCVELP